MDRDEYLQKDYAEEDDNNDYDDDSGFAPTLMEASYSLFGIYLYLPIVYGNYGDEKGEWNEKSRMWTASKDATILADEKRKPDVSGTSMDSQVILHHHSGDEDKTNMHIGNGASEENMATERKKREKRKSQDDGVKPQQSGSIEIAIEEKKNEKSISERCAADALKDNFSDSEIGKQLADIYSRMNAVQRQIFLHNLGIFLRNYTMETNEPVKGKPVGRRNIKMPGKEERKLRKYK